MGFDLTGLNPQSDTPQPRWTKGDPWVRKTQDDCLDANSSITQMEIDTQLKEEYDDYMESKCKWQESTDGAYFRNNVWWWRPLWNFVCHSCDNILTDKDAEMGTFNDGHKISKTKAKRIASKLRTLVRTGQVKAYEEMYARHQEKLPEDSWNNNYPFNEQNVLEFMAFCEHSGGFEIW
jgi:hypothetical protein